MFYFFTCRANKQLEVLLGKSETAIKRLKLPPEMLHGVMLRQESLICGLFNTNSREKGNGTLLAVDKYLQLTLTTGGMPGNISI